MHFPEIQIHYNLRDFISLLLKSALGQVEA